MRISDSGVFFFYRNLAEFYIISWFMCSLDECLSSQRNSIVTRAVSVFSLLNSHPLSMCLEQKLLLLEIKKEWVNGTVQPPLSFPSMFSPVCLGVLASLPCSRPAFTAWIHMFYWAATCCYMMISKGGFYYFGKCLSFPTRATRVSFPLRFLVKVCSCLHRRSI